GSFRAVSRTTARMAASCSSLVGSLNVYARDFLAIGCVPSVLAVRAEHGLAPVDRVRADEPCTTAMTRLPGATVRREKLHELARFAVCVSVIADAGSPRHNRLAQNLHYRVAQIGGLRGRDVGRHARRINARAPERFVCVDVTDADDLVLI